MRTPRSRWSTTAGSRHGTSGSGLGQLGIRERAATHEGQVDIGPRVTGGYRVRVRYPLGARRVTDRR